MIRLICPIVLALGFFTIGGCMTVQTQFAPSLIGQAYPVRTPPEKIELYRSGLPNKKFSEIGAIHGCCSRGRNGV